MKEFLRILVTGESAEDDASLPREAAGRALEWTALGVLAFERIVVPPALVIGIATEPFGWVVLASPRAVRFFGELLLENGIELPPETRVACLGARTAEAAASDGFTPDFVPTEPGSEGFLAEFEARLGRAGARPSVLLPAAEGGRLAIRDRLAALGCPVHRLSLYRSLPRTDLAAQLPEGALSAFGAIVFTSPSSVDALLSQFDLPPGVRVLSLGTFPGEHLARRGVGDVRVLPHGDYQRIGEVLC